jgi:hypothetical protein
MQTQLKTMNRNGLMVNLHAALATCIPNWADIMINRQAHLSHYVKK